MEVKGSFLGFTEPLLATSLLDDESDMDEDTLAISITKREYQLLNRK